MVDKHYIIILADKNLSPAIMERSTYIQQALDDQLSDSSTYTRLSYNDAIYTIASTNKELMELIGAYKTLLPKANMTYFQCFFKLHHQINQFCIRMKVHKNPMTSCPIVPCWDTLQKNGIQDFL
jgi:hypothetical protein